MSDHDLDAIRIHIERAHDEVSELCLGTRRWTMRIPAQPDRDSDLVIADALADAERLLAEVERLRANQLPDGGEWQTLYGAAALGLPWDGVREDTDDCRRRIWLGPITPIEPAARQ